ncbi:uncharacterized protein PpBr36_10570 [Pyricularia pennisetigena]|uniref:uncharacterized protein n=1 Tax=Pyricularia pennisetigena TaxID=1578925 RepID=UPI00114ED89A|nr:uncharacterized protein PpBr36_10570 [Pyricularia pennisetigena]TLS21251.1 hypothetical protein PpBr36_10570 [Pyricularia pennisetigena]
MDPIIQAVFGPPPDGLNLSESRGPSDSAAVSVLLVLAICAVVARFVCRFYSRNAFLSDDWAILVTLAFVAGAVGLTIAGSSKGAGSHVWTLTIDQIQEIYQVLYIYTFIYGGACGSVKLSILFFYMRVFGTRDLVTNRPFKAAIYLGVCLSILYPVTIWVTMGNVCKPVTHFWTQFTGTAGVCIDINTFFLALAIINMLIDFYVLLIPVPQILALNMSTRKKGAVLGLMLIGGFVCVASILRCVYLSELSRAADVTFAMGPVFIWSAIEPCFAIVGACLPHLAPLRRTVRERLGYSGNKSSHLGDGGGGPGSKASRNTPLNRAANSGHRRLHDDDIGLTDISTLATAVATYNEGGSESGDDAAGGGGGGGTGKAVPMPSGKNVIRVTSSFSQQSDIYKGNGRT